MTLRERLFQGLVIPAHPLALNAQRKLDERRQQLLTRYYMAAGAGGVAVGVHTTQFAIREAGLFRPVLQLAREEMRDSNVVAIAGAVGPAKQAVAEAEIARELGYWIGRPYWGRGYASFGVKAVLDFAFEELNLALVGSCALESNTASRRVLEKNGFRLLRLEHHNDPLLKRPHERLAIYEKQRGTAR